MRLGSAVRVRGSWSYQTPSDQANDSSPGHVEATMTTIKDPEFTVREITILGDSDPGVRIPLPP